MEFNRLIEKANSIYLDNFPPETRFERALFFSWHCDIRDCKFCYMSTQGKSHSSKPAIRSLASLIAEAILCRRLGWEMFLSGGVGALSAEGFFNMLKKLKFAYGNKIWLNVGPLSEERLLQYKPYIKGVVGSIETVNKKLHDIVCPSKPINPYLEMFRNAEKHDIDRAMTMILGIGETIDDFETLKDMIEEYNISKIHIYSLNPHPGTVFEDASPPTAEYQAEWIARTRIAFPKMNIVFGIWLDRVDRVAMLLRSGANTISKFPMLKKFNSPEAREMEKQADIACRNFIGSVTIFKEFDIDEEAERLPFDETLKEQVKKKLANYVLGLEGS